MQLLRYVPDGKGCKWRRSQIFVATIGGELCHLSIMEDIYIAVEGVLSNLPFRDNIGPFLQFPTLFTLIFTPSLLL